MPKIIDILNTKYFNQLSNGADFSSNTSDFTTNLVGNTREKIKAQFDCEIQWYANASPSQNWDVFTGKLVRDTGNFKEDGFFVLGQFQFYADWTQRFTDLPEFTAQVDFISNDGSTLDFTVLTGSQVTTGVDQTNIGIWADPSINANNFTSCVYSFGFINNNESVDFTSKTSLNEQQYFIRDIVSGVNNLEPKGTFKDWQTGSSTVEPLVTSKKNVASYQFTHEFILNPFYLEGELSNLQDKTITDTFKGNETLNHVFELDFRHSLNDTVSNIVGSSNEIDGSVGWFEENFNGLNSDYKITAVNYVGGTNLDINNANELNISIDKLSGSITSGQQISVYFAYLPTNESEYQDTSTTLTENFILDNIVCTVDGGLVGGANVFDDVNAVLSSGSAIITTNLSFSPTQIALLKNNSNYLISVQIQDNTLNSGNSDRVHLIADVSGATYDITPSTTGLLTWDKFNLLTHSEDLGVDAGSTTIEAWNEDGILLDAQFQLDLNKNAFLNDLQLDLIAYNSTLDTSFVLDSVQLDISNQVISNNIQQININQNRGYLLNAGNQFDFVNINFDSEAGGIAVYDVAFGQKIKWQDWIRNLDVDTVFYNNSEANDNLNFKSSNYSNLNGYKIKIEAKTNVNGDDINNNPITYNQIERSGNITVYDYSVSDDGSFTNATVELLEPNTLSNVGKLLSNQDTLMKVTWQNSPNFDVADIVYINHRIQPYNAIGDNLEESSTLRGAYANGIVKDTTFSKVGSDIVSESLIDYTKLDSGLCYNLSARIQALNPVLLGFSDYECETVPTVSMPPPAILPPISEPKVSPAFCGTTINASGRNGITDILYQINYEGFIAFIFNPFAQTDKAELGKLQADNLTATILATTHFNNTDPSLDIDLNSGLSTLGSDINTIAFDSDGRRFLGGDAAGSGTGQGSDAIVQYIGLAKGVSVAGLQRDEYILATGDQNPPSINGTQLLQQQYVWMPVSVGDNVVARFSGKNGTIWEVNPIFCYQTN